MPTYDVDNLLNQAIAYHQAGRLQKAESLYNAVIELQPDNATACINLGSIKRVLGHIKEAIIILKRAVKIVPNEAGAWFNLGNALTAEKEWHEALAAFNKAVQLKPSLIDAYINWGDTLANIGNLDAALEIFQNGLRRSPNHPGLLSNKGNVLLRQHRITEGLSLLEKAGEAMPDNAIIARNLANAHRLSGNPVEALNILDPLINRNPNDSDARCIRALALFSIGHYQKAWIDYSMRWHTSLHEAARPFKQRRWSGQNVEGKTILIWGEQAVGDEIMFGTALSEFESMDVSVIIETEYRLVPLFRRAFPNYKILARTDPPNPDLFDKNIDFQISIGDIGQYLRPGLSSFDRNLPYLKPDVKRTELLTNRYCSLAKGRMRVGVSWRSGIEHAGIARSLDLQSLKELLAYYDDIWWLSLQFGDIDDDLAKLAMDGTPIPYVDNDINALKSMDDLVAQISCLDLVISVANTTAHIAGALGKKTYALLPYAADWRWQHKGDQCHWYPSVTLLRQKQSGRWSSVIRDLIKIVNNQK